MMSRLAGILQKDEDYKRQLETPQARDRVWEDEEEDEGNPDPGAGEKKQ